MIRNDDTLHPITERSLSKAEVIDELDRRSISYFTETPEELEAQVEALRELFGDADNQA